MKGIRSKVAMVSIVPLLALGLAGCGGATKTASSGKNSHTLVVWTFFSQVKLLAQQFDKTHPGDHVIVKVFPGNTYETKLQTALSTGYGVPDVFDLERSYIGQFNNTPYVANLSKMGANALTKNMVPYVAALGTNSQGNVIGIADSSSPGGFWYRRAEAKKWLGTENSQKISQMVSSWSKIIALGKKVYKASHGTVHLLDTSASVMVVQNHNMLPWVNNGNLQIDPAWSHILNVVRTVHQDHVSAGLPGFSAGWGSALNAPGSNGAAILFAVPSWATFMINNKNNAGVGKFGVAAAPAGYYEGGTYRAIYSKAPNKKLAWEFLKFDASPQWQVWNLQHTGNMPSDVSVFKSQSNYKIPFFGNENVMGMYYNIAMKIPGRSPSKYGESINGDWGSIVAQMVQQNKTTQWAYTQLKQKVADTYPSVRIP